MKDKKTIPSATFPEKIIRLLLFSLLFSPVMVMVNCASAQAGVAVSNIPLEGVPYTVLGEDSVSVSWITLDVGIIAFPLKRPPVEQALQELMKKKGGDALINIRYSTDRMIFLPVTVHRFHVTADVVKLGKGESSGPNKDRSEKKK